MANTLVQFRTEEAIRIKAVNICEKLGIDLQTYLRMCMYRLIQENGIPFSMKIEDNSENLEKKRRERAAETMAAMRKFQDIVGEDRGWDSEEDMLKDLADFRRKRVCR